MNNWELDQVLLDHNHETFTHRRHLPIASIRYDAFSVQQGLIPQKEYHNVAVPDYMILNYDFIVYTHYIEQMNKIVERINWSAGSYWGEPGKMRFKTNIESWFRSKQLNIHRGKT